MVSLLAACGAMTPGERSIDIGERQILAAIEKRFPFNARYLDAFDVQLDSPSLSFRPDANRVGTRFALQATNRYLARPIAGTVDMSYGLRIEPSDNTVRMTEVRVDRMDIDGLPEILRGQAERLGPFLAERFLSGTAIYTFKPDDVEKARRLGVAPGEIRVLPGGLRVTLKPAPPS